LAQESVETRYLVERGQSRASLKGIPLFSSMALEVKRHRCISRLPADVRNLVLSAHDDARSEVLRERVLNRRDRAIAGCMLEIAMSLAAMALYDLRRSMLVPIMNAILTIFSVLGLYGALGLRLVLVQVHGILTTGLLIAVVLNFFAEELFVEKGLGSDTLPSWVVLTALLVPYSVNLVCSVTNLQLASVLTEFRAADESSCGLLKNDQLEQQAIELTGQDVCCVCMNAKKDSVLVPCGHKAMCLSCGEELRARGRQCPLCRTHINGVVRVFES